MSQISSIQELLDSLPDKVKSNEVIAGIVSCYMKETEILEHYASRAEIPLIALSPFEKWGSQYVANFWVKDLALPLKNEYNWHLQNTSQWLYAGCILVQDGRVSTHH